MTFIYFGVDIVVTTVAIMAVVGVGSG